MDELELLEAGTTEEAVAPVPASSSLPAPDFTGSLDYIDSLASRRALSLSQRDALAITTGAIDTFDYLSPIVKPVLGRQELAFSDSSDMRPLQDARLYSPLSGYTRPTGLIRSASDVVAPSFRPIKQFSPDWRNPLDPSRDIGDLNRTMLDIERRANRHPFQFRKPNQVLICLKRKARRQVMSSLGLMGRPFPFRHPRYSYWSRVVC